MARGSLVALVTTLGFGLLVLLILALLLPEAIRPVRGAPLSPGAHPSEPPIAGLYFDSGREGALFEAPLQSSDVQIDVSGEIARVTLRQRFQNPSPVWLEGIYVFPLPERSAVDRLVMTVGERRIEGRIMERAEARRVYEAAAAQGQRASLLDSERPNVFVTSVANVGPGDEIVVEIQYQDKTAFADGSYSLRFPMVVAPRYTPLPQVPGVRAPQPLLNGPRGVQPIASPGAEAPAAPERGRDRFGPVRHPDEGPANPLSLVVRLDAGFAPEEIESLYHPVEVEALDAR
ncbi:MAG: VIT domain-containing protein, partial [Kiloniellales bacterium]